METKKDQFNLDANESIFFNRQLEHVKTKTYDVKYKQLKATMLLPVETDAHTGADTITYRSYSKVGMAKIISDYAHDFPRVDTIGSENTIKVRSLGDSYGYSIKEIRRSQKAGARLDSRRANTARRAIEELINTLAWSGDSDYDIQGLIDYPGITEYTLPADGTGSVKLWSAKTPDQIVRDLNGIVDAVVDTTNEIESPDTMIMPYSLLSLISNTRMTDGNDKTIKTFFLENNDHIKNIESLPELKTAGAGGTTKIMCYPKDPNNIGLQIPQAFEQFPAQWKGMEAEIPCHAETAGVIVYYPLSVSYADGA